MKSIIDHGVDECPGCGSEVMPESTRECVACSNIICGTCGMFDPDGEISMCQECDPGEE